MRGDFDLDDVELREEDGDMARPRTSGKGGSSHAFGVGGCGCMALSLA